MRGCLSIILYILIAFPNFLHAQIPAIGNWREHLPYINATQVLEGSDKIWAATTGSVFSIDKEENSIDRWSKVNGLSETGVNAIGWDQQTNSLVIAYTNSNIDIIRNRDVKNISAIKNSQQSGDKTISHIYTRNGLAYLSAGIGIIVIDIARNEVKDTYIIGSTGNMVNVFAVTADDANLYAATAEGLKKAAIASTNLPDYRSWQNISGVSGLSQNIAQQVGTINNNIYAVVSDSIFVQSGGSWSFMYRDGWRIRNATASNNRIILSETLSNAGRIVLLNPSGTVESLVQNNILTTAPMQAISSNADVWIADSIAGVSKYSSNNFQSYVPNSPLSTATGEMIAFNNTLWVASGTVSLNWQPRGNRNGLYRFSNNEWKNYNRGNIPAFDSLPDLQTVAIDPRDETLWAGSYGGGLLSLDKNEKLTIHKQNSPLQPAFFSSSSYRVSGLAFDNENNLWIANYGAPQNLHVRKTDGTWRSFSVPFALGENAVASIVIDDLNQKWIIAPNNQGLICFNHGSSIDNPVDDRWKWYRAGAGNGNLPDNNVLSLIKDKNSFIWVGTRRGIGIVQCPQEVFSTQGCDALLPVVQQDNFAGYLFRDEEVQAMAVDGADRKWVGTKNGVWLISADAEKTIYRFTAENSPLPDNNVHKIAVDGNTGEVFFSTAKGIVSFRGTATEANAPNNSVLVFPNPVPPGYNGTIAIRGILNNAIVKITELNGRLVYQTRAQGGQAVWNGKNYRGQTISSGVYLVWITDDTSKEKMVTKIVFISK
jgi:hypothetical protein